MMIAKIGWEIARDSIEELVDKGLDPKKVQSIEHHITEIPGVSQMHMLRTRQMGADALLDVHIEVSPQLSVSEGHRISDEVSTQLTLAFPDIAQVLVHIDPENDEAHSSCSHLPLRDEVVQEAGRCWQDIEQAQFIEDIILHYLDGKIILHLTLPLSVLSSAVSSTELLKQFTQAIKGLDYINKVDIFYSSAPK
jgi:hypothetical protein